MTIQETVGEGEAYTLRHYRPGDERGFLDLYNEVWSAERTTDWFDWRYRDNPYVEEVTMFVAEYEGEVVATRPFKAYRVRAGDERRLAFLGTDTMTDSAHRRKGLFSRTTMAALSHYADRPVEARPAFLFNHSNQYSLPGYRKMGWEYLSEQVRYNRVQRAGSYVPGAGGFPGRLGGAVATALNRAALAALGRRAAFDVAPYTVERHEGVPAATLADIYAACRPDAVHVVYDEAFYEWHFAEPGHEPEATYVVRRGDRPVAGLVVNREYDPRNDTEMVTISHVVPAAGGPERVDAIAAGVEVLLEAYAGADLLRTHNPLLPRSVLRAYGFLPDDRLPMSKLATQGGLTLGIRPLIESEWDLAGRSIRGAAPSLWTLA